MIFRISWFVEAIQNYELAMPFVGSSILMVTLNFIIFVPLGFLIPVVFKSNNWNFKRLLLLGFFLSFAIEFLQLFGGRMFEIDDIIMNGFGTAVGYILFEAINGIRDVKTRKKSIVKGLGTIASTAIILFSISIISNGDSLNTEVHNTYSEMGIFEVEINDIAKISLYTHGVEEEIPDEAIAKQIYSSMGMGISNGASYYVKNAYNDNINNIIKSSDDKYLEILFNGKHNFTFYNNENLLLEEVQHILYNLNDGSIYIGIDNSDNFINALKYENEEYPFEKNQNIEKLAN